MKQQDAINQIVEALEENRLTVNLLETIRDRDGYNIIYEPHGFYKLQGQLIIYGHESIAHIDIATKKLLHVQKTR